MQLDNDQASACAREAQDWESDARRRGVGDANVQRCTLRRLRRGNTADDPKPKPQPFLGGYAEGVTPVPIPNTEVKPLRADDTALEAVWESRSPPGIIK